MTKGKITNQDLYVLYKENKALSKELEQAKEEIKRLTEEGHNEFCCNEELRKERDELKEELQGTLTEWESMKERVKELVAPEVYREEQFKKMVKDEGWTITK